MRVVELIAEARVPQLVGLLQDGHRHRREPHRPDEQKLWKKKPVKAPVGLPKSVEYAEPKQEESEEESRLEDGVDGGRQEGDGEDGPGEKRVVKTEQRRKQNCNLGTKINFQRNFYFIMFSVILHTLMIIGGIRCFFAV